ncbi:MAG: DNA polymerase III subunit beta [Acidobacteriota bacterium]
MKVTIEKGLLGQVTSIVQRAASTKDAMPALSALSIVASDSGLSFSATDLEIGIRKQIKDVNIQQEGKALVNARYFADLVRYLPDCEITLDLDTEKSKLHVLYGRSSSSLNLYNDEDFPELPLTKLKKVCALPQGVLKEAIKKTAFAAATNHFKPVFTGILFDFEDGSLKVVASDTHRLAFNLIENVQPQSKVDKLVIPARTVQELSRILEDGEEEINIGLVENNIVFYNEENGFYFLSRLIEGQYPNYNQVIPKEFINNYLIDAAQMANSLERAALMPTDLKAIKHVQMDFRQEEVVLSAFSEKMGEMTEVVDNISCETDKTIKVAFNTRYLLDIIKILQGENEKIKIKLTGAMSPAVIHNPESENYIYVLVPLRTG